MFAAAALIPGAPLLVPELAGEQIGESAQVRAAVLAVGRELAALAANWLIVGPAATDRLFDEPVRDSFTGFGADVQVSLRTADAQSIDGRLPTSILVGAWLRTLTAPELSAVGISVRADSSPAEARAMGREIREAARADGGSVGLLVVTDGSTMLGERAPGGYDPDAIGFQRDVDELISRSDWAALEALSEDECLKFRAGGQVGWRVLATTLSGLTVRGGSTYVGAPFGVGYHVGLWEIDEHD